MTEQIAYTKGVTPEDNDPRVHVLPAIRNTKLYREMNAFRAIDIIEIWDNPTEQETLTAFQWLHDHHYEYRLQGFYGRMIAVLIEQGDIEK